MLSERILKLSLSDNDVESRIKLNLDNKKAKTKSRSIKRILYDNIVTLFNILNVFLMLLLVLVGSYKNMLFMGVVVCNTIIGIIQEIRSKISVDKLSIVVSSQIDAVRNKNLTKINIEDIVLDDIIKLSAGSQIPADCKIVEGFCFVNESLLTGESELVEKGEDAILLSGSFISSGEVYAKVIHTGKDNFASRIHSEASAHKKINSQILNICNKILTFCSIAIFPVGIALFSSQYFFHNIDIKSTVESTVAALVGMIPEGMILLTSTVLAVAVIRLSKKNVLVKQLYCIETLARVDVLCLDKTGTITTGNMEVVDIIHLSEDVKNTDIALKSLAVNSTDNNATIIAINNFLDCDNISAKEIIPFSSEKKWSAMTLTDNYSYVLGAAEFIYNKEQNVDLFNRIENIDDNMRVLTLSKSDEPIKSYNLPQNLKPIAIIVLKDEIRSNAIETIEYFKKQGVQLKIISGDNHKTVERISKSVGVDGAENSVDASTLKTEDDIKNAIEKYTVFGRVTPQQKKQLVTFLKEQGHIVAMTGDGVNDVLALREADCSIAMASGSDAAKNISQLVLVDNDFSSMPKIVAEGRRSINNIFRSASLFIVKTIYSLLLAISFVFMNTKYPFSPIQLSLVSAFTIGLPSFVLALEQNKDRIKGDFLKGVLSKSLPSSILVFLNVFILGLFSEFFKNGEVSTMATIITAIIGVMLVWRLSMPFNKMRVCLLSVIIIGLIVAFVFFGSFFGFVILSGNSTIILLIQIFITVLLYNLLFNCLNKKS